MQNYQVVNGTSYHAETPQQVIDVLERVRHSRQRVKLHYGNSQTGQDWHEACDTRGTIGRSMGPSKIPILLANSRSTGGGGILDHCIVAIRETGRSGKWLYRHPNYTAKQFRITESEHSEHYPFLVFSLDGNTDELVARFKTHSQARRYIDNVVGNY